MILGLALILAGGLLPVAAAWSLGRFVTARQPFPEVVRLAVGAAVESLLIFLLLAAGIAHSWVTLPLCALAVAPLLIHRPRFHRPDFGDAPRWLLWIIAGIYGAFYLIHALAPEIQPDAMTYHLGLVREYARTGSFPGRVAFFEMIPQGIEMLFVPAYQVGAHSAAKLTHFFLLCLTPFLIVEVGKQFEIPSGVSWAAALLYVLTPIVGLTGTSGYNDAALVFFILAAVWMAHEHPALAGLLSGFCYAIKMNAGVAGVAAGAIVVRRGGLRAGSRFAAGAAVSALPWLVRNWIVARNPLAPLANAWFPNPYVHLTAEESLRKTWGSLPVSWPEVPWQLAAGVAFQGILGPILFLIPVGLLALKKKEGRWLWLVAAVLAFPWVLNHGTRFLMPALPFVLVALVLVLPRIARWGVVAAVAILCWPQAMARYVNPHAWRLGAAPWRAALRLETEDAYLRRTTVEYPIATLVREFVKPGEPVLTLMDAPRAFLDHEMVEMWQSALGERLTDSLMVASQYRFNPFYDVRGEWPAEPIRGLRFRLVSTGKAPSEAEWCVHEIRTYLGDDRVYSSPQWSVTSWPNRWEVPSAFDGNLASRWRTWQPMRPGMFVEARFDRPQRISAVDMVSHTPVFEARWEIYGLDLQGRWKRLQGAPEAHRRGVDDLRPAAVRHLKRSGIRYLLLPTEWVGGWQLAQHIVGFEKDWGIEKTGQAGFVSLYRLP